MFFEHLGYMIIIGLFSWAGWTDYCDGHPVLGKGPR